MSVVVTPATHSSVLEVLEVSAVVSDAGASVAAWRDSDADALVADSVDAALLEDIRAAPDGSTVPVVQITSDPRSAGPADAVLDPDGDREDANDAIERAIVACEYRAAVSELYEACQGRDAGNPEQDVQELRATADAAYQALDDIPPSALYSPPDTEQ